MAHRSAPPRAPHHFPAISTPRQPHIFPNDIVPILPHAATVPPPSIQVRSVWAYNLGYEFNIIRSLLPRTSFIALDVNFPGFIHNAEKPHYLLTTNERYAVIKANVDDLKPIQVGLTLSDLNGRLPDFGTAHYVWEFNLKDFDLDTDRHALESINMLNSRGFNFDRLHRDGIDTRSFTRMLFDSGLIGAQLSWVTFSGAYDFAYLLKIVTDGELLPANIDLFMEQIRTLFGDNLYDVKHIMKDCPGLYGGLERVAYVLRLLLPATNLRQAGTHSVLALQAFTVMKFKFLKDVGKYKGELHGLQVV